MTAPDPALDAPTSLTVVTRKLRFVYTNWRGEVATRTVEPIGIWFGSTQWHPEQQWFMRATDLDKGESRDFAMGDMKDITCA